MSTWRTGWVLLPSVHDAWLTFFNPLKIESNDSNCILNVTTINIFVDLHRLIAYYLTLDSNFINVWLFVCLLTELL